MSLASLNFRIIVRKLRKGSNPITGQAKPNNWKFWSPNPPYFHEFSPDFSFKFF